MKIEGRIDSGGEGVVLLASNGKVQLAIKAYKKELLEKLAHLFWNKLHGLIAMKQFADADKPTLLFGRTAFLSC